MQNRVKYIYDILVTSEKDAKDIISGYVRKFQKTERTFWTDWKKAKAEFDLFTQKQIERTNKVAENLLDKSVSQGLQSKLERQLQLQSMLKPDYRHEEVFGVDVKTGKVIVKMRVLNPKEIIAIHAELSKMDGSYAPAKIQDVTNDSQETWINQFKKKNA